jgi:hypothetical protein
VSKEITPAAQWWLEGVLARLGVPESQRHECIASASVRLDRVSIGFMPPACSDESYLVARAVVADVPPPGQCESLYAMVLEVQAMLCGPHVPVLGLDWPARRLLVSCTLETSSLGADDAIAILGAMHQMAIQWREAIAKLSSAPAGSKPRQVELSG